MSVASPPGRWQIYPLPAIGRTGVIGEGVLLLPYLLTFLGLLLTIVFFTRDLFAPQGGVQPAGVHELCVAAVLDDSAVLQDEDGVGVVNS